MLILLSPAKTLDFKNARVITRESFPEYYKNANELVSVLQNYEIDELKKLMGISDKLAILNKQRYLNWLDVPDISTSRQAICAFKGEVYTGLDVNDWSEDDFNFSQTHIRILSGMYGLLRPLDYINPYRLEMGIKLPNSKGENLYRYWKDIVTENINNFMSDNNLNTVINLASNEYFKVVDKKKLRANVITPVFKDSKNGEYKVISFYAKKARGVMSRYIVKNRIRNIDKILEFNELGYVFNDKLSESNTLVFTRDN